MSRPSCEPLYAIDTSHYEQEKFIYEYPLYWVLFSIKTHNTTLLFDSTILKHGRHFDYWNQPLNMRMSVCYLDCHEAGRCCYLVMYIQNLLRPLQPFYFHFWSTVFTISPSYITAIINQCYECSMLPMQSVPSSGRTSCKQRLISEK
jgi:hypothetical protein